MTNTEQVSHQISNIKKTLSEKALFEDTTLLDNVLTAYLSEGHVLLEGPPGTGKTLSAKLLASAVGKSFKRIQFTSDLLPQDILGSHIFDPNTRDFQFIKGPIFADIVVADEINRAPPRTQSALLEAMEERQATIEGQRFPLNSAFFVVATQNPFEYEGTFPLPEVQLDRFLFKICLEHQSIEFDQRILKEVIEGRLPPDFDTVESTRMEPSQVREALSQIPVDDSILSYISTLLSNTRSHPLLARGSSVRGGIALAKASRAAALVAGRSFVIPDDIKRLVCPALAHRITLSSDAIVSNTTAEQVLIQILETTPFPK